ncbi:flagellar motor switch phosphatase FliY [Alkalibacillus almallahensis]|uniref:flagellar motor switch phosphatase FliY n=1 Tax=Alkalibacillus almallahensis TaxID=1379154 RepID=UPI0014239575|nr:flagellar motor switch phosphatase FliY [Alkalibacillus almallahensis]NIK10797.1 flagellar motor switch protein FliN/FliY [Alkalibacillus almallahensis]
MNNNDNMLSQEEIDALLNSSSDEENSGSNQNANQTDENSNQGGQTSSQLQDFLTDIEIDAIGEIGNISFGSSATALSSLLNQKVEITTPVVSAIDSESLVDEFPTPHVAVKVDYTDGFRGMNLFVIKNQDAAIIADLMLGGDGTNPADELGEIQLSAVQEAMNQMMGSAATSMSSVFNKRVDITPPDITVLDVEKGEGTDYIPQEDNFVKVSFQLQVGELIDSNIMQLLPVEFAKEFVDSLLNAEDPVETESTTQEEPAQPKQETQQKQPEPKPDQSQQSTQAQTNSQQLGQKAFQQGEDHCVDQAQFEEFGKQPQLGQDEQRNLDLLMDIPLNVSVELGRSSKSIKEILELNTGSIVELDKFAGEPVDILVNNKLIAKGEVVVIDENFGVRVSDILSQAERIQKLR